MKNGKYGKEKCDRGCVAPSLSIMTTVVVAPSSTMFDLSVAIASVILNSSSHSTRESSCRVILAHLFLPLASPTMNVTSSPASDW